MAGYVQPLKLLVCSKPNEDSIGYFVHLWTYCQCCCGVGSNGSFGPVMFLTPLEAMLLDDRTMFPWITLEPLVYESPLTGETYTVPRNFRTDGSSVPAAIIAIPVIGQALALRYFGRGVWLGFKAGVLHDYLRRADLYGGTPVPARIAHMVFREALYACGYPEDLCETYYQAVVSFNS